jgi:hypothetical protein
LPSYKRVLDYSRRRRLQFFIGRSGRPARDPPPSDQRRKRRRGRKRSLHCRRYRSLRAVIRSRFWHLSLHSTVV